MRIPRWLITSKVPTPQYWPGVDADLISGEGENDGSYPIEEAEIRDDISDFTPNFAPRGSSKFQERVRNRLPNPRDARSSRQIAALGRFYDTCSVCLRALDSMTSQLTRCLDSPL